MVDQQTGEWREPFLILTNGGPTSGQRVIHDGDFGWTWPLPDTLGHVGSGRYVKVSESQLPAQTEYSHLVRGAEYDWRPES